MQIQSQTDDYCLSRSIYTNLKQQPLQEFESNKGNFS